MRTTPDSLDELLTLLRRRHARVLEGRPGARPGRFKEKRNRAGSSVFVDPDHVVGTFRAGFEILFGGSTSRSIARPS